MSSHATTARASWRDATDSARWPLATGVALLLEAALLAALAWYAAQPAPKPPPPMVISLVQPRPLPTPPAPKPPPPRPKPRPRPHPQPRVHHPVRPPRHVLPPPPQPRIQPPPAPLPATRPAMPVAPPPPPPPKPAKPDPEAVKFSFEAALREAIQATVHFPEAARLMHLQGRTLVRFTFRDGHVGAIRVVTSSGVPPLDQAAIAAVRNAPCPSTPAALAGRALSFEIWVRFHLDSP